MSEAKTDQGTGRQIVLRPRSSRFIAYFYKTPTNVACPHFYVIRHANGCSFSPNCRYCYLMNSFRASKLPVAFTNVEDLLDETRRWIRNDKVHAYALNTGNLSDSLTFEGVRPIMRRLADLFREEAEGRPHFLLMVTKGGMKETEDLRRTKPCKNVVVSFSVNTPEAASIWERGAAKPTDRLQAAKELKEKGWRVRLRIDPMLKGFDYQWLVDQVKALEPERVTIGSLRAENGLKKVDKDGIFRGLTKEEGSALWRYPETERIAMYRLPVEVLRPVTSLSFCEEPASVSYALGLDPTCKACNCTA